MGFAVASPVGVPVEPPVGTVVDASSISVGYPEGDAVVAVPEISSSKLVGDPVGDEE